MCLMIKPTFIHGITNTKYRDIWNFVRTQHSCENIITTPSKYMSYLNSLSHSGKHVLPALKKKKIFPYVLLLFMSVFQYHVSYHKKTCSSTVVVRKNDYRITYTQIKLFNTKNVMETRLA